ncbi:MAG: hypothetical protein WC861_06460 [Candidatus Micrarchaeia archaeon]|jgi:hypothetical protein
MAEKSNGMKGQLFSTEMMVSFSVFLGAIIIFLFVWNTMYNNYVEEQSNNKMQVVLIGISDAAVMSPGDPSNWELASGMNANSYGFASSRNTLSQSKLYAMQSYFAADYGGMKDKAGAGGYDMFVDVKDMDGSTYYSFGSLADTTNQSISAVTAERLALMGDEIVKLRVQLWRVRGRSI